MNNKRNWTVLIIGGASGTGKSSIAYQLGEHYCVNVIEIDDIHQVMKKITSITTIKYLKKYNIKIYNVINQYMVLI